MTSVDPKDEIKELREALEMTQEQFARAVGVSFSTVSRWETGRGSPSPLARRQIEELRLGLKGQEDAE